MAPVDVQVYQFFVMVLAGAIIGALYDIYRTFRLMTKPGQWATAIYDTFFWLVTTALVLAAVFYASWGEVRAYVFIGMVTGALIYFKLASPLVLKLLKAIWQFCAAVYRVIAMVFYYVVVLPVKFVIRIIGRILITFTIPFIALAHLARYTAAWMKERYSKLREEPQEDEGQDEYTDPEDHKRPPGPPIV